MDFGFHDLGHGSQVLDSFLDLGAILGFTCGALDEVGNAQHHGSDFAEMRDGFVCPFGKARLVRSIEQSFDKSPGLLTADHAKIGEIGSGRLHWHRHGSERHFGILMGRKLIPETHHQCAKQFIGIFHTVELGQFPAPQVSDRRHGLHVRIGTGDHAQQSGANLVIANWASYADVKTKLNITIDNWERMTPQEQADAIGRLRGNISAELTKAAVTGGAAAGIRAVGISNGVRIESAAAGAVAGETAEAVVVRDLIDKASPPPPLSLVPDCLVNPVSCRGADGQWTHWTNPETGKVEPIATAKNYDSKFRIENDHILPQKEIERLMQGQGLTPAQKQELLSWTDNLQPLPKPMNCSKGCKPGLDWEALKSQGVKIDEGYKLALDKKQNDVRKAIEAKIDQYKKIKAAKGGN